MNSARVRYSIKSIAARSALSVALVAGVSLPFAGGATQAWAADGTAKDEVVYVKSSATGDTQGIYVVNIFDTEAAEQVSDPANYTSVSNLTTNDALTEKDGLVTLTTTAGEPFYYQGEMDASTQLPWDITFTYYLNGEEVQPQDIAGADGLVKIVFDAKALDDNSTVSDFSHSYILQAQGTFAQEHFAIADAGDATLAHSGSNEVVSCLVLPGEDATFEISGLANNFQYDGWQVAGMSLSMAVDLASQDTSQLTDACEELENATVKLSDGASTMFDGSTELSSGANQVASGAAEVAEGAGSLSEGASSVATGAANLSAGVDSAVSGLSNLSTGAKGVAEGWNSVYAGIGTVKEKLGELEAGSATFSNTLGTQASAYASQAQIEAAQAAYQQALQAALANPTDATAQANLNAAVTQLAAANQAAGAAKALSETKSSYDASVGAGISALATNSDLQAGAAQFDAGLSEYLDGASSASEQASALATGAAALADGANSVADGANSLHSGATGVATGANQVAEGATSLEQGASQLSSGASTLATSVDGMDSEILDELQNTIDEKLGEDFTPHSFVVPSNTNVDKVQFVYVIEGIDEPEDDADTEEEPTEEETFFDRLFALFND